MAAQNHNGTVHSSPTAVAYARSVLELAQERNQVREIGQELSAVRELLVDNPGFREFLDNPGVGANERGAALEKIFKGRVSELVYFTLRVLNEKGRLRLLDQIIAGYDDLLDELFGNVEVDVTSARQLDAEQVAHIGRRVGEILGKTAVVHQYVDDSILGGLVVRVGDQVLDASVRYQLQAVRQRMLETAFRAGEGARTASQGAANH